MKNYKKRLNKNRIDILLLLIKNISYTLSYICYVFKGQLILNQLNTLNSLQIIANLQNTY